MRLAQLVALDVEQIEFQLQRGDGGELQLGETVEHHFEGGARFAGEGDALLIAQGGEYLGARRRIAPHRTQRGGDGPAGGIGIAIAIAVTEHIGHLAARIHQVDGFRNLHAAFEDLRGIGDAHALAAQDAAQIHHHRIEIFDLGVGGDQGFEFLLRVFHESGAREGRSGG